MRLTPGFFLAVIYVLSVALYYLDKSETVKYFQYLLPGIGLAVSLHTVYRTWLSAGDLAKLSQIILILCFVNLLVLLSKSDLYFKFLQEGFLFIGASFFAITLIGNLTYNISKLLSYSLFLVIFIFLVDKGHALFDVLMHPNELVLGVITSTIETESSLSFYFALFSLYFIIEKNNLKSFLAILFMILSFKRIAILGFVVAFLLYIFFDIFKMKYNRKIYSFSLSVFNFAYLLILLRLIDGSFDEFISTTFGVSSNFLFMGRLDLYSNVLSETGYFNVFGVGIGKISTILNKFSTTGVGEGILLNLHSDILKYYLELGVILFTIFIFSFIYYLSRNKAAFCLVVMLNIILLTDNVSIYFGLMVLFYLINFKLGYYSRFSNDFQMNNATVNLNRNSFGRSISGDVAIKY